MPSKSQQWCAKIGININYWKELILLLNQTLLVDNESIMIIEGAFHPPPCTPAHPKQVVQR
jgi:hypothetical protein